MRDIVFGAQSSAKCGALLKIYKSSRCCLAPAFTLFASLVFACCHPGKVYSAAPDSNRGSQNRHEQAIKSEKAGNLKEAVEFEQQAVRLSPRAAGYRGELSRLLWEFGYVDKAISECRQALESEPDNWKCRFNLAVMLQVSGDTKAAVSEYEKVLKINQSFPQARLGLVQACALSGKSQEAVNHIDALVADKKRYPDFMIEVADTAIKIDQPRRAREILRDYAASTNARALQLLFLAAAGSADEKLARSIQRRVMDSAPKDWRIYFIAAQLTDDKGEFARQEEILEQAMKVIKNDGDLYSHLAGLYMKQFEMCRARGDEKSAQAWLSLADKTLTFAEGLHVKGWTVRFQHAGVYSLQGKHVQAAAVIEELARREPKNELILYCRGRMRSFGNNPAAAAKRQLQSLFKESGESAEASTSPSESIVLACSRAHFKNLSCGCHTGVLEYKWKHLGGVLFARIVSENRPVGIIIHDLGEYKSRIISAAASLNEQIARVETRTVKGLGELAISLSDPAARDEPPLTTRLSAPELQRL